jgi:uncharacterized membrane protein
MGRVLAAVVVVWPIVAASAVAARVEGSAGSGAAIVYAVGAAVCHQRPERSFHTAGVAWPVCARCSGLYIGGMIGALLAVWAAGRRVVRPREARWLLLVAGAPTALAWVAEWISGADVTNMMRAVAALPLGAAVAALVVTVATRTPEVDPVD